MITAEFGTEGRPYWRKVVVAPEAGTVTFQRCHHPSRFVSWGPDPEYTCRLADLRGVYWNRRYCGTRWRTDRVLEVVTPAGRAVLPQGAAGFEAVHAALMEGLGAEARLRWSQTPGGQTALMLLVVFGSGIALTILCAMLLERRLIPAGLVAGALVVLMPLVLLHLYSRWIGKPTVW